MLNEFSKFKEIPEDPDKQIKEREARQLEEFVQDIIVREGFDPKHPDLVHIQTPLEHAFFFSTYPGRAFHPNLPIAAKAGSSIDTINAQRRERGELGGSAKIGDKLMSFTIKLKDLAETDLNNSTGLMTIEIKDVEIFNETADLSEDQKSELEDKATKYFQDMISGIQEKAREALREED